MVSTRVITIGLSGPSSGGKTTVSRYLRSILPNSTIVHQDDFYKPETLIPLDPKTGLPNWDCPEAIDFQSLIKTLHYVKEHGDFPEGFDSLEDKNPVGSKEHSTPIPQEVLDSLRDHIMAEVVRGQGQDERERAATKFVILDGFMLYGDEQLRNTIDVRFYLTAPYQVLKERRESRKGYATLEGYWVDPPGYFENMVWPNYLIYNEPFAKLADAIDEGQVSGAYDATNAGQGLLRADPMTQKVDVVSSGKASIHDMVESISNLLAKRISEL
ncbi:ribosylnicotinamide kinase [Linnemannia schmuckeri]|uniref:Ribosylnicotinamide kinase n=1 Tax=Linnemannia schmuckeri TaxID=64567 RepID=A0A9P5VEM4_9FUNG|nr:ribosylnicotinamide kinase [Linnemannia schmuckeri]